MKHYDYGVLDDEAVCGGTPDEVLFDVGEPVVVVPPPEFPPEKPKIEEPDRTETMIFEPPLAGATISECGKYRYVLWRKFKSAGIRILWIMLNPSTATALEDDNTIRRVCSFSKREGAAEVFVCNLFGYRATYPADLRAACNGEFGVPPFDVEGPENRRHVQDAFESCDACIVAWGNHGGLKRSGRSMMKFLNEINAKAAPIKPIPILCLGVTKYGRHPGHPLFIPGDRKLEAFDYGSSKEEEFLM